MLQVRQLCIRQCISQVFGIPRVALEQNIEFLKLCSFKPDQEAHKAARRIFVCFGFLGSALPYFIHCVSHHQDGLSGLSVMLLDVITLQKYGRRFLHRTLSYTSASIP